MRNPRDFWAGAIYLALGLAVVWIGRTYALGTSARMGPGYFPSVLGTVLAGFGAVSIARSFIRSGEAITNIAWKPMGLILGSIILFGLLLEPLGLIVALPVLVIVSALASRNSRPDIRSIAALIAMTAFCILVFVKGLGVPMPILGSWLAG